MRWAGLVAEVLTLEAYWEDTRFIAKRPSHSKTPDNIYRLSGGRTRQVPNSSHDSGNIKTDLNGRNSLVFGKAWHFGDHGPDLPEYFGLHVPVNARRTEPMRELPDSIWLALEAWLDHHDVGLPDPFAQTGAKCGLQRMSEHKVDATHLGRC